jgi:O-antigen ligase
VDSAVPLIVCALLGAGAVLLRGSVQRAWAMLGALVLTPVILVSHIWDSSQLAPLRDHPLYAVVLAVVAIAIVGAAAWLSQGHPAWLALAAAAALPFRIPISSGGSTANLLVPLYAVMAAGVLAHAVPRVLRRIEERDREPHAVEWALMIYVVLYAVQASYSNDFEHALEQVVFFYVPFALLYAVLVRVPWSRELAGRCLAVAAALAVVFVAIGFVEYTTRTLLLNPKVISSNQFSDYFRVNSLFFDPNIYGRFLAMVMIGVVAALLWAKRPRTALLASLLLAYLWAGLVLTLSQSSFTALLAGLVVLAALRWRPQWVLITAGVAALLAVGVIVVAGDSVNLDLTSGNDTSGRSNLISGGVHLIEDAPIFGHGSGSFAHEYRAKTEGSGQQAASASHTIPVTVWAEQGIVGLISYAALVVLALLTLLRHSRGDPVRAAIAAAFVALLVHTLLYAAFLEDPLAWVLLAAGVWFGTQPRSRRPRTEEPAT